MMSSSSSSPPRPSHPPRPPRPSRPPSPQAQPSFPPPSPTPLCNVSLESCLCLFLMLQVLRARVMPHASLGHVSSAPEVDCLAFAGQTRAAGVRSFRLSTSTAFLLSQVSTAPLFAVQTRAAGVRSRRLGTFLPILLSFTVILLSLTDHCLLFRRLQAWYRQRLVPMLAVSLFRQAVASGTSCLCVCARTREGHINHQVTFACENFLPRLA